MNPCTCVKGSTVSWKSISLFLTLSLILLSRSLFPPSLFLSTRCRRKLARAKYTVLRSDSATQNSLQEYIQSMRKNLSLEKTRNNIQYSARVNPINCFSPDAFKAGVIGCINRPTFYFWVSTNTPPCYLLCFGISGFLKVRKSVSKTVID